jgi:hypothetical protein
MLPPPRLFKRLMPLVVMAVLFGASSQAYAELSFQLAVATHNQPGAGSSGVPPDDVRTSLVALGERYMSITAPGQMNIYDFAKRRRYQVDLKAGTYVGYSLFDTVGFRVMELQNRANLGRAMAAAKIERPVSDPVFDEQALSVLGQPARRMSEAADGADIVLSVDGEKMLRIGAGGTAVSANDAAAFIRYLRYQFGGHPLVLARLSELRRIPPTFVMYYREVGGSQTRAFTITGLTSTAPPAYDLAALSERADGGDEIDQLLDRAARTKRPAPEEGRQQSEAEMRAAFADLRPLDAMLGAVEWTLASGAAMAPFSAEQQEALKADPNVRAVLTAMNPTDKTGLNASVRVMQAMRAQTMRKRHMLQLFEANNRVKLGDRSTALPMYASVLRANPALAGAYKDMGDTLLAGFDMPRAWRSWDEGRRIAPGLNLFVAVNQFEQSLVRDHPEYF